MSIDLIPPPYRLPAIIFFALFPWLVVAATAFKAWRIYTRKRHAQMAYRALEERCRAIVDTIGEFWPESRKERGDDLLYFIKERILDCQKARANADDIISSIHSKNLPGNLPPALRWYVNQVKSIQHHLEEAEYAGADVNPAGTVLHLLNMDRLVTAPAFIVSLDESHLRPRRSLYGVEEMEKQFRETIGKLAMHAPSVPFVDSLPEFAEKVMEKAIAAASIEKARFIYDNSPDIMTGGHILPKPPFEEWLKRIHEVTTL